jgi:hypothetical protein
VDNEALLRSAYVAVGLLSVLLGVSAYLWLRAPATQLFAALRRPGAHKTYGRSFQVSTILFPLPAFLSVSYFDGCSDHDTYARIVADRDYLLMINREQISASVMGVIAAVTVWSAIVLMIVLAVRRERRQGHAE